MELNLNLKRLQHIKNDESVFEALIHLGGKASATKIVKHIANSLYQPEEVVRSEVKQVLRAAVVKGYLVRHGKNYLLSRSCRVFHVDSRQQNAISSEKQIEMRRSNFTTFRYPAWWSRFWNRFVDCKNEEAEHQTNCNYPQPTCSTEPSELEREPEINLLAPIETSQNITSLNSNSLVVLNESLDLNASNDETENYKVYNSDFPVKIKEDESNMSIESISSNTS